MKNEVWSLGKVNEKLQQKMEDGFASVWIIHQEKKVSLRTAAHILVLQRLFQKAKSQ